MTYEIFNGSLYNYTAGALCGVLVKESVMKKLAKLQAKHLEDVKRVLRDGADNCEVFPSMWTLHYPGGKQTSVYYIDKSSNVNDRIKNAIVSNPPRHHPVVFVASEMDEAKSMADARYEEIENGA